MPRRTCASALTLATMLVALLLLVPSASGRVRDSDHDGLSNRFEKRHSHTNPHRADSDRDRLRDRFELNRTRTKPLRRDTDRDALTDGYEWRYSKTSPRKADTDGDGVSDGMELMMGTNPRRPSHPKKNGTGDPPPVPDPLPQPLPDPLPDVLPPETAITSGPPSTDTVATASFSFTSSEDGSTFQCRLDAGTWGACVSPASYSSLANGSHTFDVRATDAAGNTDPTPASQTWTVSVPPPDTTAPNTSITTGPSGTVASDAASFTFTSTEGGSTFECRLDGGSWGGCASPKSYSGLANGSHTFRARATDAAGNTDSTAASRTWTVNVPPADTTAPDTTISSGPPSVAASSSASFLFASSESGSTFECRMDAGSWGSCSSPRSYSNLANGFHTFDVRATDGAGNIDATPASQTWMVDVVVPPSDTTPPETTIDSGPSGTVASDSASLAFSSSESGSTFACRLDAGAWGACTSPKSYSGLANGSHTFDVRATDGAGNTDASPASRTWTVNVPPPDTTPPDTTIGSGPSGTVTSSSASFSFTSSETGSTFACRMDAGSWGSCSSPKSYSNLANGSHTFDVRATDGAGNTDASPASRAWTVNVTPTGGNNCIADPSACGFPDVETTGVTPGTTLTPVSGNVKLSTPGQVYENKLVTGSITVTAPDVTIRNVKIVMTDFYGIRARTVDPSNVRNLLVVDSEIDMGGQYGNNGIAFNHYTARRVFFHNGSDCTSMGDTPVSDDQVIIEDSLCTIGPDTNSDGLPDSKTFCQGSSAHFDGFQSDGGWNLTIRHNTIRNPCSQTSAIIISSNTSPIHNVTIQDNLMAGGGWTVYCNAGPDVPNETVTGNRIARTYYPQGGYYGPFAGCDAADVFTGNVWDDTGAPAS